MDGGLDISKAFESFGLAGGLLVAIVFGIGYGIYYVGGWFGRRVVEPLVDSHTSLVNQLKISDAHQTETLSRIAETQQGISGMQKEIIQLLKQRDGK